MVAPGMILRPEQRELLAQLVEAERKLGRREPFSFITVDQEAHGLVRHTALLKGTVTAFPSDLQELHRLGLIIYTPGPNPPNGTFDLTQLGIAHHDELTKLGK